MRGAYRRAVELAMDGVNIDDPNSLTEEELSRLKPIETFWITRRGRRVRDARLPRRPATGHGLRDHPAEQDQQTTGSRMPHSQTLAFRADRTKAKRSAVGPEWLRYVVSRSSACARKRCIPSDDVSSTTSWSIASAAAAS